jgi:hypothetical protein
MEFGFCIVFALFVEDKARKIFIDKLDVSKNIASFIKRKVLEENM